MSSMGSTGQGKATAEVEAQTAAGEPEEAEEGGSAGARGARQQAKKDKWG